MRLLTILISISIVLAACGGASNDDTSVNTTELREVPACPSEIQTALTEIGQICSETNANQLCYGNIQLNVTTIDNQPLKFDSPGDIVDLQSLSQMQLIMDASSGQWGAALMKLQASVDNAIPGQNVSFFLFGNLQLQPEASESDAGNITAFHFETGIGDAPCREAPDSGILVQTPEGVGEINFAVNEVQIALGSTAYLQAQPDAEMVVSVIEGRASVTAQNVTKTVLAGQRLRIELDNQGLPTSQPQDAETYDVNDLQTLPTQNLSRSVGIATRLLSEDFSDGINDWRIFQDATNFEAFAAEDDPFSDGYVCAVDLGTGIYWYFESPEAWAGDRSAIYGGTLDYTIREAPRAGNISGIVDVQLIGAEVTLDYYLPSLPLDTWTHFSIPLEASEAWTIASSSEAPTEEEFRAVLGNLQSIRIRGEYIAGSDTGCLDDVSLNIVAR